MTGGRGWTRRKFLTHGAAFLAAPLIVPSSVLGAKRTGRPAPSDRLTVGAIGTGGMGTSDVENFYESDRVQVVAVCDVDREHREDARKKVEDHYAKGKASGTYKGCDAYNDFRELIARTDIDAVIIATPDHWHVPIALAAARSGKDIFLEKPLSRFVSEGRILADVVKRYGRVLQVDSWQRSDERFRRAAELVRNGRIGKLHTVRTNLPDGENTGLHGPEPVPDGFDYEMWLGPAPWAPYTPLRCHYHFRAIYDYAGGEMTDWGVHHNDIAQWALDMDGSGPVSVSGKGTFPQDSLYTEAYAFTVEYTYANGVKLVCTAGGENGITFEGTEGSIFVSRSTIRSNPATIIRSQIGPNETRLYRSVNHRDNFLDCVRTRAVPVAPAETAHRSATISHLGNIAMRLGRPLAWDPVAERFPGDAEANRHLTRALRAPWRE